MEGDLYEGISMLRPVYGNWLRKNVMLKIQMIGIERAATGVPVGVIPHGQINSSSETKIQDSLSRFVAHERQYMTIPEGYKVEDFKIRHDAEKVDKAIRREDQGMAKSFLANFMELGLNSSSGSWALGSDLSDIFLSGIEIYAEAVTDAINTKLIPMLIRANFGEQKTYPKLKIEGINDKAGKEFVEILKILKENGLLQITDQLQEVIHQRYNLPFDKDIIEDVEPIKSEDQKKTQLSEIKYNLTEPNIGRNIEIVGKEMTAVMAENMKRRGNRLVSQMMEIWRNTPKAQRRKKVNQLKVPGKNEYKAIIGDMLADIYVQATKGVKKELAVNGLKLAEESEIRNLPADSKAAGASQADLLVESQDADLRKNLFFSFTSKVDVLPTETQMEANLSDVVKKYVEGASIRVAGPNAVANAVNLARNAVFQKKETLEKIESFIFTNPSPEALICIQLTGRVFTKEEYIVSDKLPPLHHNCNSWIKAQIIGRPENKPISPAGLSIQGTSSQIEAIQKSITL